MNIPNKVCILAAGRGTRLEVAQKINKILLPVNHKAVLSHILEYFPIDTEFVIAVGHESEKIKDFVALVHNNRNITYIDIDNYDREGSGPGYSLLCCKEYLQCPFYLMSGDTLVKNIIPPINRNWIGVSRVEDPSKFLMVSTDECESVTRFRDKKPDDRVPRKAFIGIAGIKDYDIFWKHLEDDDTLKDGEYQVSNGLEGLIEFGIDTFQMEWYDTGTDENYQLALEAYNQFEFLPKPDEFLYFEGEKVVKFFADRMKAQNRVKRAEVLSGAIPQMIGSKPHFYAYTYVPGKRISHTTEVNSFLKFLEFSKDTVWKPIELSADQKYDFETACYRFYHDKTYKRIQSHFKQTNTRDEETVINGVRVPKLQTLFNNIPWEDLSKGIAVPFHGDPQPENIIVTQNGSFSFLDWREDFGGLLTMGDLYYDLAKVYHALIIAGEVIRAGKYEVCENGNFNFHIRHNLLRFKHVFEKFVVDSRWDLDRVRMLTALVYLNLAPLYPTTYGQLLFLLGKSLLKETQEGRWTI